jgi:hypothetical protein
MRPFRLLLAALVALGASTPAAAQFKKLRNAASKAAEQKAGASAPAPATSESAPADGGVVVLTPEVVDRLLAGDKAAKAERVKAEKEDTPYGRYIRGKAAYEAAKAKCGAAQVTWVQRAAADEKLVNRYTAAMDKAMAAQQKGDMVGYEAGTYEALAIIDPSCAVKDPKTPDDYSDMQRAVDERAEQAKRRATGLTDRELGLTSDRVLAILTGSDVPGGASASEKSAVSAKDPELKSMYGIRDAQAERVAKPAPVRDTAPAPAQVQAPTAASSANQCMMNNVQKHEKQLQALGERAAAAQEAGNNALTMAIADTIMRIQMAGCTR